MKMPLRGYHRKCLVAYYLSYNLLECLRISSSLVCWCYFSLKGNVKSLKSAESICITSAAGNASVFQFHAPVPQAIRLYGRAPLLPAFSSPSLYTEKPRLLIKYPLLACHHQG